MSDKVTDKSNKLKESKDEFRLEVIKAFSSLLTAAFGLVAALAWNDAIKTTINNFFDKGIDITLGQFAALYFYAIIVTIIAVLFTILIARSSRKVKSRIEKAEAE